MRFPSKSPSHFLMSGLMALLIAPTVGAIWNTASAQVVPVKLQHVDDQWHLIRENQPYRVHGAGGQGDLELLAAVGGNSNRTWGVDDQTISRLDEAHRHGITVAVGLWLEHERHGFDYSDEAAVAQQKQRTLEAVRKLKHHPAVLVWGVGNEMEGNGKNPLIWKHIEDLCQAIKQEDPDHPTMTVIAEIGQDKVTSIQQHCPSVDIVGINSYGGIESLPQRYQQQRGSKPYLVTEFGPIGTWEVSANSIGAIEEPTSTQKAETYRRAASGLGNDPMCLGSYAFLWGHKQEGTPTWFGMLLPDGKKLAAVDAMSTIWTGKPPSNQCPQINKLELVGKPTVKGDQLLEIKLDAVDPENKTLQTNWVVLRDAQQYVTGGDKQETPPDFSSSIKRSGPSGATIKAPTLSGVYRAYAYVDDGVGAAVANVAFRVEGKPLEDPGKKVALPLAIDGEQEMQRSIPFSPSGWMGNTDALKVEYSSENPKQGDSCLKCEYNSTSGWGGVVWQHPENDWGDQPGGVDLSGAKKLSFWVRGERNDQKVKFGFGLISRNKPYFDTGKKEMEVQLETEWKQVVIDVENMDLRRIKTAFFWSAAAEGKPLTFYLDGIEFK